MYHCVLHADHEREPTGDAWEGFPTQPTFKNCTFDNIIARSSWERQEKIAVFFDWDSNTLETGTGKPLR
jgi:hypothetical protein